MESEYGGLPVPMCPPGHRGQLHPTDLRSDTDVSPAYTARAHIDPREIGTIICDCWALWGR